MQGQAILEDVSIPKRVLEALNPFANNLKAPIVGVTFQSLKGF